MSNSSIAAMSLRIQGEPRPLSDFIPMSAWVLLTRKFPDVKPGALATVVVELVKYLVLASETETLFFPGSKLLDDVWHALITETRIYQEICERVCPGKFLHHTGEPLESYEHRRTPEKIREEQISWLVSYVSAFGDFTSEAVEHLPLAKFLMASMKTDVVGLNVAAKQILEGSVPDSSSPLTSLGYLEQLTSDECNSLDHDRSRLAQHIRAVVRCSTDQRAKMLEFAFSKSGALGFTLHQYYTAFDRLAGSVSWRDRNAGLWQLIADSQALIGLATTHLGRPGAPSVLGTPVDGGFLVSGLAPWATGYRIFDYVILGFVRPDGARIHAVIPFREKIDESGRPCLSVVRGEKLAAMDSTNTVALSLERYFVMHEDIVLERHPPFNDEVTPASTFPELGIAASALTLCSEAARYEHDVDFRDAVLRLRKWKGDLRAKTASGQGPADPVLAWEKDEIVRQSTRLALLGTGGRGMRLESTANRLAREAMILDTVFQPRPIWRLKCARTGQPGG